MLILLSLWVAAGFLRAWAPRATSDGEGMLQELHVFRAGPQDE